MQITGHLVLGKQWHGDRQPLPSLLEPINLSKVRPHMYLQIDRFAVLPAAHTGRYYVRPRKYLKRSPNPAVKLENSRVRNGSIKPTCEAGLARQALMTRLDGLWEGACEAGTEGGSSATKLESRKNYYEVS